MRAGIYFLVLFFVFSCSSEEKSKNGKVVQKTDEVEEPVANDTSDNSKEILNTDSKDILKLKGGTIITYVKRGSGNTLQKGDMVEVKYKTFLSDGKLIDGSDLIGKPLPYFIGINMSVKGWDEAFVNLKPGDKVKLHLPAEKAYGKKGYGTMVPPDSDLDFEIEVMEKVKPITTKSGLKYYYLVQNETGKIATEGKTAEIHYYGWLFDNAKMFDSSHMSGKTYKFKVGGGEEILAWEEMSTILRKGEKVLVIVPSEMAYAEKGVPELVPPHSKLVYIIEMMNIL